MVKEEEAPLVSAGGVLEENFAPSGYLGNKRRVNYPTWKEEDKKTQFADEEPRKATSHSISVFFEEFSLNLKK